jgi:phosphoribosylanthranilate isomerase
MVKVKICGITNPDDACMAWEAGAEAIGLVFAESPRQVDVATASAVVASIPPFVVPVGVFVNEPAGRIVEVCRGAGIAVAQLSGTEPSEEIVSLKTAGLKVIKAAHVTPEGELDGTEFSQADAVVLDTGVGGKMGGTGVAFDLGRIRSLRFDVPVIMAGGLTPDNVAERVRAVSPYAVDVSSGVEASPGRKDRDLVTRFVLNAKRAHETTQTA